MQEATAKASLERIRILILREVMRVMKTTPVATMGLLFGRTASPYVVAITAATYHLKCKNKWRAGAVHIRLPKEILSGIVFDMEQDRMTVKRDLDRSFKICLPGREEWKKNEMPIIRNEDMYTDDSKTDQGTSVNIFRCRKRSVVIPFEEFTTVFQSKVVAILNYALMLIVLGEVCRRMRICRAAQGGARCTHLQFAASLGMQMQPGPLGGE
ncbi:hypothetical protein ALC56_03962 [Trachymyrmex septentrionalis]|uniref:Uncharacterized protein n=1 Tax=Trachymyrmex septentrionalis TaxID=34720 RepID=A0A151JYS7_9HYME|nr:hypothetical protein ALC56_03962 [Trachymyrmex septentrionalis]